MGEITVGCINFYVSGQEIGGHQILAWVVTSIPVNYIQVLFD